MKLLHPGSVAIALALAAAGCGQATVNPSAPTAARQIAFTPEARTGNSEAVGVTQSTNQQDAGTIVLAVTAFDLVNAVPPERGFWYVEGRLTWDSRVLTYTAMDAGDFMRQGGAPVNFGALDVAPGDLHFVISRSDRSLVQGTGEILRIQLAPTTVTGSTAIQFASFDPALPTVFLGPFAPGQSPIQHYYGGPITVK